MFTLWQLRYWGRMGRWLRSLLLWLMRVIYLVIRWDSIQVDSSTPSTRSTPRKYIIQEHASSPTPAFNFMNSEFWLWIVSWFEFFDLRSEDISDSCHFGCFHIGRRASDPPWWGWRVFGWIQHQLGIWKSGGREAPPSQHWSCSTQSEARNPGIPTECPYDSTRGVLCSLQQVTCYSPAHRALDPIYSILTN